MATLDAVRRLGMVQPEVIESTRHSPELATHDRFDNRSNASGELGFEDALAQMVGPEGRGVPTIIDMVNSTRGNVAIWAVSLMRQSVAQAGWHVAHRSAFGAKLIDKPLMVNVLADMELEVEAATLMMARLPSAAETRTTAFTGPTRWASVPFIRSSCPGPSASTRTTCTKTRSIPGM